MTDKLFDATAANAMTTLSANVMSADVLNANTTWVGPPEPALIQETDEAGNQFVQLGELRMPLDEFETCLRYLQKITREGVPEEFI